MNPGYYNQQAYPGVAFPALQPPLPAPEKPAKPWPLRKVNLWMTVGAVAITVLAVLLAAVAPLAANTPPSTEKLTLAYHSPMTQNDTGALRWDENSDCGFTDSGYVVSGADSQSAVKCQLQGSDYQNFIVKVTVVAAASTASIGFLGGEQLDILDSGRYIFYPSYPDSSRPALPIGSAALHNMQLGVSERANDIIIEVVDDTFTFYANGQLLATYTVGNREDSGSIWLGTNTGEQAEFSNVSLYI